MDRNLLGRVSTKIVVANIVLLGLLLFSSFVGYFGTSKTESLLRYLTGPGWETADSTMEAVIETESQMLGVYALLSGDQLESRDQDIETAGNSAKEAFERLTGTGVLPEEVLDGLTQLRTKYENSVRDLVALHQEFDQAAGAFRNAYHNMKVKVEWAQECVNTLEKQDEGDFPLRAATNYPYLKALRTIERPWSEFSGIVKDTELDEIAANATQLDSLFKDLTDGMLEFEKCLRDEPHSSIATDTPFQFQDELVALMQSANLFVESANLANTKRKEYTKNASELLTYVGEVEDSADGKVAGAIDSIGPTISTIKTSILIASLLCIAAALIISVVVIRSITKPLNATIAALQNISDGDGDLTRRLNENATGEFGSLAKFFNRFASKIQSSMIEIETQMLRLGSSAGELGEAAKSNTQRASELREMSSSMKNAVNELSASIGEIASSSERAAGKATNTASMATDADTKLASLDLAAGDIGRVIAVIEEIAEQTNLLALNATIEAARAGESGRGFSVVANEVKTLAQQSAVATDDIRQRISKIQQSAREVISSIREIISSIDVVCSESRTIASAVEEQSMVSQSLLSTLGEGFHATENLAIITNETENGIEKLQTISESLESLVQTYKTRNNRQLESAVA